MGVFRRIVADIVDPAAVVTAIIFLSIAYAIFSPVLSEVQWNYFVYTSPRSMFFGVISTILSSPLYIAAFIAYAFFMLFTGLVIVCWYGKKRVGKPSNPFKHALRKLPHAIVLALILGAPLFLVFSLFAATYPSPATLPLVVVLAFLILYYVPLVSPALPALLIGDETVAGAIHEGVFVGKRWWWKILLYTLGAFIVVYILLLILSAVAWIVPALVITFIAQALLFVYTYAVITEVYVKDAIGR